MQNISIIKLANAIKHLENDVSRYDQLLNAQTSSINDLNVRLQSVQSAQSTQQQAQQHTSTTSSPVSRDTQNETSADPTISLSELNETVMNLKSDIMEAINEAPVLTYDESTDSNDEINSNIETTSVYKTVDPYDEKYSSYGSVSDIMAINLGNTKLSVDKDDKENEICSITNESGGLAFRKNDSSDVWLLDRTSDSEISFHYNNVENTPVSITPNGIKTTKMALNGKTVTNIAKVINNETINDKTIPTVGAIVKYVNANLQRLKIMRVVDENATLLKDEDTDVKSDARSNAKGDLNDDAKSDANVNVKSDANVDAKSDANVNVKSDANVDAKNNADTNTSFTLPSSDASDTTLPHCSISTIETDRGHSILIDNSSSSVSLKVEDQIIPITASVTNGLIVNNQYSLHNNKGILCKFVFNTEASNAVPSTASTSTPSTVQSLDQNSATVSTSSFDLNPDTSTLHGRFVELTGNVTNINGSYIPIVKLTDKLTSLVYGVIDSVITNTFVKKNTIINIPDDGVYINVLRKGIIDIPTLESPPEIGTILVASKSGQPVLKPEAIKFCLHRRLPLMKVIAKFDTQLIVDII